MAIDETNNLYVIEQVSGLNELIHVESLVQCLALSGHATNGVTSLLEHFLLRSIS